MTALDAQPASFGAPAARPVLAPVQGFVCLPRAVLRAPGLSVLARLLYGVLLDYARQDSHCYPGTERLRADLGCGHNQLARALRELEAGGLVVRRRRGFGKTTVYQLPQLPTTPPRNGRPDRPGPDPQTDPVRVGHYRDSEDQDAEDQQPHPRVGPAGPGGCATQDPPAPPAAGGVVALLVEQGVTRHVAAALAARHPAEQIRRQVECHRLRVTASGLNRNPAGALVKAIREDWAPPAAWAAARTGAAVRAVQAEETRRRQEEENARRREWEGKPPEERIAGRLRFWLQGRRMRRQEPTEAEIAARRAELLAGLASATGSV